jgi:hypothetical protein
MRYAWFSFVLRLVILSALLYGCAGSPTPPLGSISPDLSGPAIKADILTGERLAAMLDGIDPWPTWPSDYSTKSWEKLSRAARKLQGYAPNSVHDVLRQYEDSWKFVGVDTYEGRIITDGKLLLLMRTVFDLPGNAPTMEKYFPWRLNGTEANKDGTFNLSWPISWTAGKPRLISGVTSIQGVVGGYHVGKEYDYMHRHYAFRRL